MRLISGLLIGAGLLMLLVSGGAFIYDQQLEQQIRADPWLADLQAAYSAAEPTTSTEAQAAPSPASTPQTRFEGIAGLAAELAPRAAAESPANLGPVPTPSAVPTMLPSTHLPPVGLRIRSIAVESKVVPFGVKNGQYEVPKFYAGHYSASANPGQRGNGVYSGHVESFNGGNVFASLLGVRQGALVEVFTAKRQWNYRVTQVRTVPRTDLSVMEQTDDYRITLITCTGTWDYLAGEYSHRFVVVAQLTTDGSNG
ncbi:MAG: sortase domain-containing protein [Chloroflexota bacterium]